MCAVPSVRVDRRAYLPCALWFFCSAARAVHGEFTFTEIMYNPASTLDQHWEYVELWNRGPTPIDLTGFVFDDNGGTPLSAANIGSGVVAAGGVVVLYNSDSNTAAQLNSAWLNTAAPAGHTITWIGVSSWPILNNPGDTLGLWSSIASYGMQDFATAIAQITYGNGGDWPADDGAASIYLANLAGDPALGTNWALSQPGVAGAWSSSAAGNNLAINVGSPGVIPEPSPLLLLGVVTAGWLIAVRLKRCRPTAPPLDEPASRGVDA